MRPAPHNKQRAFTFAELVIAILFLGLCLAPFLSYLSQLVSQQQNLALRAQDESWASLQEQALVRGVDSSRCRAFSPDLNVALGGAPAMPVERNPSSAGGSGLTLLRAMPDGLSPRTTSSLGGWELAAAEAWSAPQPPPKGLEPRILEAPSFSPEPGSLVGVGELLAASSGIPARLSVSAYSESAVCVRLLHEGKDLRGIQQVASQLTAPALMSGTQMVAWCEYDGKKESGDKCERLPDGRLRWYVREAAGLRQYEPSARSKASYYLSLGAPLLRRAELLHESGASLAFSRLDLQSIESGAVTLRVEWPAALLQTLGPDASALLGGFDCVWNRSVSLGGSELEILCAESRLAIWENSNVLDVVPSVPASCRAEVAQWVFTRQLLTLKEPELLPEYAELGDTLESGRLVFRPGADAQGKRLGRVSARAGSLLSTGETLSLELLP